MGLFGFGKKNEKPAEDTTEVKNEEAIEEEAAAIEMDGEALFNFARMYEDQGEMDLAIRYYTEAAEKDYAPAQFSLGMMYEKGENVPEDKSAALSWYQKAAEQGYMAAQFNLGYMYYYGEGTSINQAEGLKWIAKAAEQGDDAAKEFMAATQKVQIINDAKAVSEANKKKYIQKLMNMNEIYMIYSGCTNSPQVGFNPKTQAHQVFVFSDLESAKEVCELLKKEKRPAIPVKIEKKDMVKALGELYLYGVNTVVVQIDDKAMPILLYDIVRRKDFSKLPVEQRPIENPMLQRAMIYYMQEVRAQNGEDKKSEKYQNLDKRMVSEMIPAKFLIAFREAGEKTEKGTPMQVVIIKNNQTGAALIPVFTDIHEFSKFARNNKYKVMVTDFEKMANVTNLPPEVKHFVINPIGCNVPITFDWVRMISDAKKKAAAAKKTAESVIANNEEKAEE